MRPPWNDPRTLIGVAIAVVSILVLVVLLLTGADISGWTLWS